PLATRSSSCSVSVMGESPSRTDSAKVEEEASEFHHKGTEKTTNHSPQREQGRPCSRCGLWKTTNHSPQRQQDRPCSHCGLWFVLYSGTRTVPSAAKKP